MRKKREPWNPLLCNYPESDKINKCSMAAETLYTRLLAKSDDNSNFYGDPFLLMCHLFSRRAKAKEIDVTAMERIRNELVTQKLISLYKTGEDMYLHILNCKKHLRKDINPDVRFPEFTQPLDNKEVPENVTDPARGRIENAPSYSTTDTDTTTDTTNLSKERETIPPPIEDQIFVFWNAHKNLPGTQKLTKSRRGHVKARLKEKPFLENWQKIIKRIHDSSFLTGSNDRGWKATFDWLIANDTNYIKVMEGKYDNRDRQTTRSNSEKQKSGSEQYRENEIPYTGDDGAGTDE